MIFTGPQNKTLEGIGAAVQRLVDEINRFHQPIARWPVFADDAAAADGNLKVGDGYVTPEGIARRRMA
jgi:hypothetical protein